MVYRLSTRSYGCICIDIIRFKIGAIFALWGCAMQGGANNYACLLVGRIIAGFAIGYVDIQEEEREENTASSFNILFPSVLSMTVPLYQVSSIIVLHLHYVNDGISFRLKLHHLKFVVLWSVLPSKFLV